MRRSRLALACTSALLLASPAAAQDPYTDFRVPEARSFTWQLNGSARWNGNYDAAPGINRTVDARQSVASLFSDTHQHAESEAFVTDHFLSVRGNWSQLHSTTQYTNPGSEYSYDNPADSQDYDAFARTSTTRYRGGSGWGLDAFLSASYTYVRNAFALGSRSVFDTTDSRQRHDSQAHIYSGSFAASLGPGYGRVRDVTGVFDMQVLEQRLEATGRLSHPLSPAARQRLAELFSVSGDFGAAHDRPDRYLWREVERLLREDGAIEAGTFDAWSLMRALEPATLSISITRLAGWRISGAYELQLDRGHADFDDQFSAATLVNGILVSSGAGTQSSRLSLDENQEFGRLDVAWHRPFGMHWQTDVSGIGRYGDGPDRRVIVSGALGLTNVLADRWVATFAASNVASSSVVEGARTSPAWTVRATAELSYFFEDSWSISAGLDHMQARPLFSINDQPGVPSGYQRQTQVVLGITYRPAGRFEAPGLAVSQRLAPGGI